MTASEATKHSRPVALVTRPAADAAPLVEALERRGFDVLLEPLLAIEPVEGAAVDLAGVQGVLATSANGVRALAQATGRRDLPLWAVGDATARAAREMGFATVESAGGDVESLAALVAARLDPNAGALLHVAGTQLAGDLAGRLGEAGFAVRRAVLYEARPATALSPGLEEALRAGRVAAAAFFSPRTAATFASLIATPERAALLRGAVAYALSAAVAERLAALPWRAVRAAARPTQDALLAAVDADRAPPAPQGEG